MEPVSPSTKGLRSALPMLFLLQRVVRGAGWRGCLLCAGTAWCLGERALRRCGKPNTFAGITAPHSACSKLEGVGICSLLQSTIDKLQARLGIIRTTARVGAKTAADARIIGCNLLRLLSRALKQHQALLSPDVGCLHTRISRLRLLRCTLVSRLLLVAGR